MTIVEWAQRHRRSIVFAIIAFALGGLYSTFSTPVSLFPGVTFPRLVIAVDAGDRPASRMAVQVTRLIEEAVRPVPGVLRVRSVSTRGSADVAINFDWGVDMVSAMLQVESAISQIASQLPSGVSYSVRRMDPTVFPVLGYSLTSPSRSLVELRDIALYQLRPALSTIGGVAKVGVLGGQTAELQVIVQPKTLASYGLSIQDIARIVGESSVLKAVGRLEENYKLYLVLADTQITSLDRVKRIVVRANKGGVLHLSDIAEVKPSTRPVWRRVTADGRDAVLFQIYQQPNGNTVQIARDAKAKLDALGKYLPRDCRISKWYDQSELIMASALSVRDSLLIGVLLAALVLLVFLRNLRVLVIAVVTVPMVLAATALLLRAIGMSFNIMTLGGMAAAVALIIDDQIVMIEHIVRVMRSADGELGSRIRTAVAQFSRPLVGSSAATIIIFAPLAFLSGVTGAFFKALSLTMAVSLVVSFVIAWLATPLLAARLLRPRDAEIENSGALARLFHRIYAGGMRAALRHAWIAPILILPFLVLGYVAYDRTGTGFMPSTDEGGFILDYVAPPGTSLAETDRLLRQVETILRQTPEVLTYSRRTGLALGGFITEASEGDFFVRLKPPPRRSLDEVMDAIRKQVLHRVPGLEIEMAKLMEDIIGDLTAVPQPIEIKLFSDDGELLSRVAERVAKVIGHVRGVVDVKDGIVPAGDALNIHVKRVAAAVEGMSADYVTSAVEGLLGGVVATSVQQGPKMVDVRVWIPAVLRETSQQLQDMLIRAPDGHLVRLGRVATFSREVGQPQIDREDLKRMVAVTGRISGRDMGSTVRECLQAIERAGVIPTNVYFSLGGLSEQQQIAFKGLTVVFLAAASLVFILLLYLYERFWVAASMMLVAVIAAASVFIGLYLTHTDLNITAMMGMTMIIGVVTEVSIFYYSEFEDLPATLGPAERLTEAGMNRMRPIAMTTFAAILALLPLALDLGQGPQMLQPLAIAIISGLCVQMPLVLVLLPLLLQLARVGGPEPTDA
ncbi:MAG: efflux RND transporter permease subunit [Myxococcales bacterium]|nr:efflux RND transporter permease subunit [Myxococcales bacterium]